MINTDSKIIVKRSCNESIKHCLSYRKPTKTR